MLFVDYLVLLAFAFPPVFTLVKLLRDPDPQGRPGKAPIAGMIFCTAVSLVYTAVLMKNYLFY